MKLTSVCLFEKKTYPRGECGYWEDFGGDLIKITKILTGEISIPLVRPFKTALRSVNEVNDIVVKVVLEDGTYGLGEAPPTAVITGDTKASIKSAVCDFIAPSVIGMDILELDAVFAKMDKCILHNTSAKAAVDMALYDAYAKLLKQPLYKILGGAGKTVETDITISVNPIDEMVRDSLDAVKQGFNILKIKVGKEGRRDIERICEIRNAVGKDVVIRVDANQGWDVKGAVKIISALEDKDLDIELVEQPVPFWDFEGMQKITASVNTKILADESVFSVKDAIKVITGHAADLVNIKLMKTGGIHNALKIASVAEEYGVQCMMGCMLESMISVSAAAHLAAAKNIITMADLDGPSLCSENPFCGGPDFRKNIITMDDALPGIGITTDAVKW